ncbi:helix-turn-helix domain-containing protein [Roseisalinus antarcticus]|jgi:hypothetical protein|uniref:OmpR/PhoB-type domain-containing protein n=1 Tax=Roseisalinus antarcticus TaxID=254357 RepID=A0A1Y5TZQ5_9RHOB|nr:helix-turn-helix domain-containing protein [Roseisalinus antarcticus]SLN75455.1 hypothetical protein ROA7023_03973 [Roseisalinus antarcticus]
MLAWLWTRLSDSGPAVSISGRALRRFPEGDVDRLLRARVLIERRKADNWPVCAHCDCGLDARPVRYVGQELRACCPDNPAEDVILEEGDLKRFGIDARRLAAQIAASGGLAGSVATVVDDVWMLGNTPADGALMLCRDVDRLEAPGAILAMKSAAAPRLVTVIVHEPDPALVLRLREAGIEVWALTDVVRTSAEGADRLVLDGARVSTGAVRLVLHRRAQSAVLDGRRLDLPPQMFMLFNMFVERSLQRDPVLKAQEIEAQFQRTPREIVRDLRKSLVVSGLAEETAEALIQTVRTRGYCLGLAPSEAAIED